jgi:hypothetical protein
MTSIKKQLRCSSPRSTKLRITQYIFIEVSCTQHYPKSDKNVDNMDKKSFAPFSTTKLLVQDFPRHSQLLSDIRRTLHRTLSKIGHKYRQHGQKFPCAVQYTTAAGTRNDFPLNSQLLFYIRRTLHRTLSKIGHKCRQHGQKFPCAFQYTTAAGTQLPATLTAAH